MNPRTFLSLAAAAPLAAQSDKRDPVLARLLDTQWVNEPKPGQLPTGVSHRTYSLESARQGRRLLHLPAAEL